MNLKTTVCNLKIKVDIDLSLWAAIKLRIAGDGYRKSAEGMIEHIKSEPSGIYRPVAHPNYTPCKPPRKP